MKSLSNYLSEYQDSHQHPLNIKIHNVCVPIIYWSVFGFLHTFLLAQEVSVGHVAAGCTLIFYSLFRNIKLILLMGMVVLVIFLSFHYIPDLRLVSIVLFFIGWIGQFYGHKIEGKKPSFFKDLLFLLIGPIWVLKKWRLIRI